MSISREVLLGEWVHSHEEDERGLKVYRRSDFPFPPARGRDAFELQSDETAVARGPGPTDMPAEETGRWELEHETIRLHVGGENRVMEVVSWSEDRIEVRE